MSDERCKCSMSIALCGEGCRYCQPQNHIDHMLEWLDDERKENEDIKAQRDSLMKVCEDETGAIKKLTEERDRLRDDMLTISCTDDLYFAKELASESINHKEG